MGGRDLFSQSCKSLKNIILFFRFFYNTIEVIKMKYDSIGEFSILIGKTVRTLRNCDENDSLKPAHITPAGTRYYSQKQLGIAE